MKLFFHALKAQTVFPDSYDFEKVPNHAVERTGDPLSRLASRSLSTLGREAPFA